MTTTTAPGHHDVYALLVGIDDYPAPVPALSGCRNDIEAIKALLSVRVTGAGHSLHEIGRAWLRGTANRCPCGAPPWP